MEMTMVQRIICHAGRIRPVTSMYAAKLVVSGVTT